MNRMQATHFFRPRLLDSFHGYTRQQLARDVAAGITVGIVALPLAMAFAIASGLKPEAGLFTAIIAGFLISALGGSRVQIGGPAGAFIVIVYGILERYGLANLILATAMSGILLFLMGLFRLGSLIRFIPVAVVIGFTNGIAVLIMLSQVKDFLGLKVLTMPADFFGILNALSSHLNSINLAALLVALGSLSLLVGWMRLGRRLLETPYQWLSMVPGSIIALLFATIATSALSLPVETIGSKFGGIPATLPTFHWPDFSWDSARFLIMPTFTLALLGAIESLLCARIADSMAQDRHNPNQELMAQGVANFITPFFGGMPATGTIARTVTNIKSGGTSPVAGMVHALTLLGVVMIAAPLAGHIPLPALAAILMFVAWNMGEWREFLLLRQYRTPYRATLLAVFFLTVVFDLTVAVEFGLVAACLTFIYRISSLSRSEAVSHIEHASLAGYGTRIQAWRLYGALFFGAVTLIEEIEDQLTCPILVIDLKNVIYIDSSGADALMSLIHTCRKKQVHLIICGLLHQPLDIAQRSGLIEHLDGQLEANLPAGLALAVSLANQPDR
ncbi:SulP family inorganic anion transporter [Limnohabitans sp. Jir72]|uniref:SulP family inorganic anion transporter n=1 Tax=Limnohabitans sp. Jir72 TaxID=1977909 RepID=UPI000D3CA08F|nr:SulP family inorganic anion transporter [Limnohabitans sp. Jir72]PUE34269.1 sodium-independent anion transporter [Limnohabitans sp. Jir72]